MREVVDEEAVGVGRGGLGVGVRPEHAPERVSVAGRLADAPVVA